MSTLKRSERNSIIEDYRNGVLNPNYEVIQTKTKGRYTVRKRKIPLTDEQLEQLNDITIHDHNDDIDHVQQIETTNKPNSVKRSKKENALFDLQNQLNTQMLYRLNELTNKVTKLKAWKKKVKNEIYEDEPIESIIANEMSHKPIEPIQPIQQDEQIQQPIQPIQQDEQDINSHQYLEQIPQQYLEDNIEQIEHSEAANIMSPNYMYGARYGIDYSKFGF